MLLRSCPYGKLPELVRDLLADDARREEIVRAGIPVVEENIRGSGEHISCWNGSRKMHAGQTEKIERETGVIGEKRRIPHKTVAFCR